MSDTAVLAAITTAAPRASACEGPASRRGLELAPARWPRR